MKVYLLLLVVAVILAVASAGKPKSKAHKLVRKLQAVPKPVKLEVLQKVLKDKKVGAGNVGSASGSGSGSWWDWDWDWDWDWSWWYSDTVNDIVNTYEAVLQNDSTIDQSTLDDILNSAYDDFSYLEYSWYFGLESVDDIEVNSNLLEVRCSMMQFKYWLQTLDRDLEDTINQAATDIDVYWIIWDLAESLHWSVAYTDSVDSAALYFRAGVYGFMNDTKCAPGLEDPECFVSRSRQTIDNAYDLEAVVYDNYTCYSSLDLPASKGYDYIETQEAVDAIMTDVKCNLANIALIETAEPKLSEDSSAHDAIESTGIGYAASEMTNENLWNLYYGMQDLLYYLDIQWKVQDTPLQRPKKMVRKHLKKLS